ncbi:MAG: hypothetical protein ACFCVE_04230, partial [Phycisphaerae bacterium]
ASLATLHAVTNAVAAEPIDPAGIPESRYVVVKDGHLSVDGQRQRFWGLIGATIPAPKLDADDTPAQRAAKVEASRAAAVRLLDRYEALGFNAIRLWDSFRDVDYTPGDGSRADAVGYFVKLAGERGFRIWVAGMNRLGDATPADAAVVDDPASAQAWAAAVAEGKDGRLSLWSIARVWDPRLEALQLRDMTATATHYNHHTGLRWADDPTFAVWELSNEEWWMRKMVAGQWQKLPAYFRNQLIAHWQAFLREKYGTDERLAAAWDGLLPGESLASGSVLLAPMAGQTNASTALNDSNPNAIAAVQALEQAYSREDFSRQRAADAIEFFMGLQLAHKERLASAIKPLGRSTRLSPMIYDTGIGYEIQSLYLHQQADAVAMGGYVNGWGPAYDAWVKKVDEQPNDHQRNRVLQEAERISFNVEDPNAGGVGWVNWLRKPPGIAQGVPWLEHNRIEGKPFLVYETQIQQPAKYRADYPLRMAALASIQDWDWVNFHYFGDGGLIDRVNADDPDAFVHRLDISVGGHPQGYHFTYDEVQTAAMRAAGFMFRNFAFEPAQNPTTFVYGTDSLYDPASMDYGGSYGMAGLDMLQTTYQHGTRIRIDPTRQDDEVIGPVVGFEQRNSHNPYTPSDQVTFDWKQGYLKLDAPAAVGWTGSLADHADADADAVTFDNAPVTLSDVQIRNAPGMFDPVGEDDRFISFGLYAKDGRPLAESRRMGLTLVSTSYNTGFELKGQEPGRGNLAEAGELPVLVARVGGTLTSPALAGTRYTLLDWRLEPIGEGTVGPDGKLTVPADKPVFVVDIARE